MMQSGHRLAVILFAPASLSIAIRPAGVSPQISYVLKAPPIPLNRETRRIGATATPVPADVRLIDRKMVKSWLTRFLRILEIHIFAGFPCIDLRVKYGRRTF